MHPDLRLSKRAATSKLSDDYFTLKSSIQKKISRHQTIKQSENGPLIIKAVPVYQKGPRPSELLLRYINAVTPPKLSRISLIKRQLHRQINSCTALGTLEEKMPRKKRNTLKF